VRTLARAPLAMLAGLAMLVAPSGIAPAAEFTGRVVAVADGDTLTIQDGAGRSVAVRPPAWT
jgi:hypothetical protein